MSAEQNSPVNVMAVMARDAVHAAQARAGDSDMWHLDVESDEARAAVAELVDKCSDLITTPYGHVDVILIKRIVSICAALARVKGERP